MTLNRVLNLTTLIYFKFLSFSIEFATVLRLHTRAPKSRTLRVLRQPWPRQAFQLITRGVDEKRGTSRAQGPPGRSGGPKRGADLSGLARLKIYRLKRRRPKLQSGKKYINWTGSKELSIALYIIIFIFIYFTCIYFIYIFYLYIFNLYLLYIVFFYRFCIEHVLQKK